MKIPVPQPRRFKVWPHLPSLFEHQQTRPLFPPNELLLAGVRPESSPVNQLSSHVITYGEPNFYSRFDQVHTRSARQKTRLSSANQLPALKKGCSPHVSDIKRINQLTIECLNALILLIADEWTGWFRFRMEVRPQSLITSGILNGQISPW